MTILTNAIRNIEAQFDGFFDGTYNEHRGPIQLIHQIERIRNKALFEREFFYIAMAHDPETPASMVDDLIALDRRDGYTVPFLENFADQLHLWRRTRINMSTEFAAVRRWNSPLMSLGDLVWMGYICSRIGIHHRWFEDMIEHNVAEHGYLKPLVAVIPGTREHREEILNQLKSCS